MPLVVEPVKHGLLKLHTQTEGPQQLYKNLSFGSLDIRVPILKITLS